MAGGKKDKKSGKGYRIICSPMSELDSFAEISSPRVSTHASLRWRTRQRARTVGASPSRCHIVVVVVVVVVFSLNTFLPELVKKSRYNFFGGSRRHGSRAANHASGVALARWCCVCSVGPRQRYGLDGPTSKPKGMWERRWNCT